MNRSPANYLYRVREKCGPVLELLQATTQEGRLDVLVGAVLEILKDPDLAWRPIAETIMPPPGPPYPRPAQAARPKDQDAPEMLLTKIAVLEARLDECRKARDRETW